MEIKQQVSTDVIDHRPHFVRGAVVGVVATMLAVFGVHLASTGGDSDPDRDLVWLASTALDRGQEFWQHETPGWVDARVVLIPTGASENTPCGVADRNSGPFYCPADGRIYVDLSFLRAINGDLARAYVIEHELGHRVQDLRGELGGASIGVELGADCYAGRLMRAEQDAGRLGSGDVAGALAEASAIGDDRICPACSTEQWTHGSSAQRVAAVTQGISGENCSPSNRSKP